MATVNDVLADLFGGGIDKPKPVVVPTLFFDQTAPIAVRLLDFTPNCKWIQTGELKPNGKPVWKKTDEVKTDDTGEKIQCTAAFQIIDSRGNQTSLAAPIKDETHYYTTDEIKAIVPCVGGGVILDGLRLELREKTVRKGDFANVETELVLTFDAIRPYPTPEP